MFSETKFVCFTFFFPLSASHYCCNRTGQHFYAVTSPPIALACSWQLFCAFMWMEIFFKMKGEIVFKKSPRTCGHRLRWPSSDHSLCEHRSVTADLKLVHREKQATFISSWFLCWRIFTGDTKLHEIRIMLLILAAFMGLGTTNSTSEWIKLSTWTPTVMLWVIWQRTFSSFSASTAFLATQK